MSESANPSQSEQSKQLLGLIAMIRSTCPQARQGEVFPLLDQLEQDQNKLDEILQSMTESPLVGATLEAVDNLAETNSQRYAEHSAIAANMQKTLAQVMALVQS